MTRLSRCLFLVVLLLAGVFHSRSLSQNGKAQKKSSAEARSQGIVFQQDSGKIDVLIEGQAFLLDTTSRFFSQCERPAGLL
jgi:hypothetical protein